jgi:hypothetical protein
MTAAHVHLALNHLPVLGTLIAAAILAAGLALRNPAVVRTALALLVAAAVSALPVHLSGEGAEEIVEDLPGVTHDLVEAHEDSAKPAAIAVGVLGLLAAGILFVHRRRPDVPRGVAVALLVAAIVVFGLLVRTAYLGGQIRHQEIRAALVPTSAVDRHVLRVVERAHLAVRYPRPRGGERDGELPPSGSTLNERSTSVVAKVSTPS